MAEKWISVRGWRKFQHYDPAKRQPPWIKVYTDLLDRAEYRALKGKHRALLHDLWMLYARSRCEVPASPSYIAQACGYPTEWEARKVVSEWRVSGESVVSEWREDAETLGESVVRKRDLDRLCKAGFIYYVASPLLAEGFFRASPEVETEKERASRAVTSKDHAARATLNGKSPNSPETTFRTPNPDPETTR